ncbi:glycine zipper 2TM domain-containing protein [bacterium]|nr:glycine zipper 2TM domain-containing protein [bacterium]
MKKLMRPVSVLCVLALVASGCETMKQNKGATGAGIGAVAGGVLGRVIGGKKHRTRNILIGAAIGAAVGYGIGKYVDHRTKTAQATNQAHNYAPPQGTRVEMVSVTPTPAALARGGSVNLDASYAIMASNTTQPIPVTETRTIYYNGQKLTEFPPRQVNRTPGTYTSSAPMAIPANATAGTYEVEVTVAAAGVSKTQKAPFTVN